MWGNFRISGTGLQAGDTEACMRGQFVSGGMTFSFFGCDVITIQ